MPGLEFFFNCYVPQWYEIVRIAEILEVTVVRKGDDPTGDVAGGHVRMSGLIRRPNQSISRWAAEKSYQMFGRYDEGYDWDGYRKTDDSCGGPEYL
jgi:hypothetical protein